MFSNQLRSGYLLFAILLFLLLIDRINILQQFGFVYTDVDQIVLWNGAMDYSKGIFHEPFFYGQSYNYMLEALIAVPLIWCQVPIYIALPIVSTALSLFPFIVLAYFFIKRKMYLWTYICLLFPLLLPTEYGLLTMLPRGFLQAHLVAPLLYFAVFDPNNKRSVVLFYIGAALCYIANQSSIIIILPIGVYLWSFHNRSRYFYFSTLWMLPILALDFAAKYFYVIHKERVVHELVGMEINGKTFGNSLRNTDLFQHLFPFFSELGIVYPFLFLTIIIIFWKRKQWRTLVVVSSLFILLLLTLAIPKVQEIYEGAGIFFTSSRLYLFLPLVLIVVLYLTVENRVHNKYILPFLLIVCITTVTIRWHKLPIVIDRTVKETHFPLAKNDDLLKRAKVMQGIVHKQKPDLIIHTMSDGWNYVFDAFAYHPLLMDDSLSNNLVSVTVHSDRRTWLYSASKSSKRILLNGFQLNDSILAIAKGKKITPNLSFLLSEGKQPLLILKQIGIYFERSKSLGQ